MLNHMVNKMVDILCDVLVKVVLFIFLVDLVIINCEVDFDIPINLESPFRATGRN